MIKTNRQERRKTKRQEMTRNKKTIIDTKRQETKRHPPYAADELAEEFARVALAEVAVCEDVVE
jgi:hypothetical protein